MAKNERKKIRRVDWKLFFYLNDLPHWLTNGLETGREKVAKTTARFQLTHDSCYNTVREGESKRSR